MTLWHMSKVNETLAFPLMATSAFPCHFYIAYVCIFTTAYDNVILEVSINKKNFNKKHSDEKHIQGLVFL